MDVVCTAGHVDHGKSTLVRTLTGMEPDRFAEERRRGLTIDIGFGWTELGPADHARTVAFVDLPGHERFIANMLAGAGPVEAALFVVAADEGWKRQSQEHLDILNLLEVSTGVVALTKSDTVDASRLSAAHRDVAARLAGTSLADVPIVAVSAMTGTGIADLQAALLSQLDQRRRPADYRLARLWVDRVFSIKGAGTVVTGTLTGGSLRQGDEVTVLPRTRTARVRGLQSLKASVDRAEPGARVAVNLAGIDRTDVERGNVLAATGAQHVTTSLDVWLRTLPEERVGRRGAWHLHVGSGEWLTTVRPVAGGAIAEDGFARLTLDTPAPLVAGDRLVLRDAGRRATVAGGLVVDAAALPLRGQDTQALATALRQRLEAVRSGDRGRVLALHVMQRGAASLAAAAAAVGLAPAVAPAAARDAKLLPLGTAVADPAAAARWTSALIDGVQAFHAAHPVQRLAPRGPALQAAVGAGCPEELAPALLDVLVGLGRLVADGPGIRLPTHTVRLDDTDQRARDMLLRALERELFSPPKLPDAARDAGASPALVRELEADAHLVRIAPDLALSARAVDEAHRRLREAYRREGPLTASRAKEILGTTRKYAVPLLELLDQRGFTRRRGDVRDVL